MYRSLIRPFLFRFDAETVHHGAIGVSKLVGSIPPLRAATARWYNFADERLESRVAGVRFPNPVGLAAGYDKSGKAIRMMAALGFGFVEIGSISADPSPGNPRPRLWRLPLDQAICVHYGLPNDGAHASGLFSRHPFRNDRCGACLSAPAWSVNALRPPLHAARRCNVIIIPERTTVTAHSS